jgi:hypothetical protein
MKTFVLTWVKDGRAVPLVQRQLVQDLQREKKKLAADPRYRGGKFQIRTLEGYKAKEIL